MRINSSQVGMESARSYKASSTTFRRFLIKDYQAGLMQNQDTWNAAPKEEQNGTGSNVKKEAVDGQDTGKKVTAYREWQDKYQLSASLTSVRSSSSETYAYIRENSIYYIFQLLFGSLKDRFGWSDFTGDSQSGTSDTTDNLENGNQETVNENRQSGNGTLMTSIPVNNFKMFVYSSEESYWESEETSFFTKGCVKTSDGREIPFNINVGMSREFQSYYKEEMVLQTFQLCDPLVINLDTDAAELSDQKFYFDIDADGEEDEISMLGKGNGYLALDQNGDGVINDGSELFGTKSGNGFADLARYDEDGNGWIDENDAIWSKLKIWCKDENGKDVLYSLAEKGVGAICLQKADTDFTLKDGVGQTRGAVRSTGVFLYENGMAGTVQHVDVAKYSKKA